MIRNTPEGTRAWIRSRETILFAWPRSLDENRSGVKTPALFLVERPTERYNLSTGRVYRLLSSSFTFFHWCSGVRDRPDVVLDRGQNWPGLAGNARISDGSSLNTVHLPTLLRKLNGINRVSVSVFPSFLCVLCAILVS